MKSCENLAVVILAAGKGTRMKSDKAKVLHPVAGKSMVCHVVGSAKKLSPEHIHVVVGHQAEAVQKEVSASYDVHFSTQTELLGTGDAVKAVVPNLAGSVDNVMVLCGDVPLIREDTLKMLVEGHIQNQNQITVLATEVSDPTGYGRIVTDDSGDVVCIREQADASDAEKEIKLINTGIYCFDKNLLVTALDQLKPDNNQAEYYLTDVIGIARENHGKIGVVTMADDREVVGVNTLEDLEKAESLILQMT